MQAAGWQPRVHPLVTPEEEAKWFGVVTAKDAHVLAGAHKAEADVLISLDHRHIVTERVRQGFPIPVQDTGEFLRGMSEDTLRAARPVADH